jgi:two-component system CheB/CheR fusion protein
MGGSATRETDVTDKDGRNYSLRVRPYRTSDHKIDGAVITLVDLGENKEFHGGKISRRAQQHSQRV